MKKSICILIFLLSGHWASAQYIYVGGSITFTTEYLFGYFNYETCEYCLDFTIPVTTIDMVSVSALPNGNVVVVGYDGKIMVFDPPSAVPISSTNLPVSTTAGGSLGPDGKIYIMTATAGIGGGAIYTFDPTTNSVMLVGTYPLSPWVLKSPFFWNGEWYAFAVGVTQTFSGNTGTFQVCTPPGSPPGSLVVQAVTLVDANCSCQ